MKRSRKRSPQPQPSKRMLLEFVERDEPPPEPQMLFCHENGLLMAAWPWNPDGTPRQADEVEHLSLEKMVRRYRRSLVDLWLGTWGQLLDADKREQLVDRSYGAVPAATNDGTPA